MKQLMLPSHKQRGAVSLFIIVFTALLVTVVTVSFIRIMVSDQQQATTSDLSQSAYDSAQAGTEDAKRALLFYQSECATGDANRCSNAAAHIQSPDCNASLADVITYTPGQEVLVKQTAGDTALQQAYTCVTISLKTDDYVGSLNQDASKMIPLVGDGTFDSVKVDWFSASDLKAGTTTVDVPKFSDGTPLINQASWAAVATPNRPPVMRTQLIQFGDSGFSLSDFDGAGNGGGKSNMNTLFLYPSDVVSTIKSFAANTRKAATSPVSSTCSPSLASGGYACSATITLPTPINGGNRVAYLNLASLYRKTDYKVTLLNGATPVQFNGVQPEIDATGRANDLFRRVKNRVEVLDGVYPLSEVDVTGSFCKAFLITDNVNDYSADSSCKP